MIITGCYERTIFRDYKTGRTIFKLNTKDVMPSKITCLGRCQPYAQDMPLKLEGELKDGQFHFTKCSPCVNTREKMVNFLSGKTFKGIGARTAEKICDFVGGNIFEYVLYSDAEEELADAFSPKIAKEIVTKINALGNSNRVFELIERFGGSMASAIKIADVADVDTFANNVYKIGRQCDLSFGICDSVAKSLEYSPYDERRIEALLAEAFKSVASSGHIYTNIKDLTARVKNVCKDSAFYEEIPSPFLLTFALKSNKYEIKEESGKVKYYSSYLYRAENEVANGIYKLQSCSSPFPFKEEIIDEIEKECGIKYSETQRKSFGLLKSSGVKILTGGPGTGKSTVVNGIVKAIKKMFPTESILLCAPTGRAAQRLKEVTGENSFTIHRALNIRPFEDGFVQVDPVAAKFIIVDEASMIDILLAQHLFEAISPSSFILFCGDTEQLPSVGPGNVLKDMIASGKIETVTLDVIYRCLEDSLISYNANNIREGKTEFKEGKDFHFYSFEKEEEMREKVEEIVRKKHDKNNPFNLQVLVSVKNGDVGTRELNKRLQQICNKTSSEDVSFDSFRYRISDKIIMMKNNYDDGYLNGDIGVVTYVNEASITVMLGDDKEIVLTKSNLEDIAPAYALTVHKSQGSEFSSVIVVLPAEPLCMLQKNLLYTAITRAKEEVFVIAQGDSYEKAVKNTKMIQRKTDLKEKIRKGTYIYG